MPKEMKKDIALTIFLIMIGSFGIFCVVLQEIGAIYLWYEGKCYVGAYYRDSKPDQLVEGVEVTFTDFWGRSKIVVTSKSLVNVTLFFRGWYKIEATYKGSKKTLTITTTTARSPTIGTIYIILDRESDEIQNIVYIPPPPC